MAQAVFNSKATKLGMPFTADSCGIYADHSPVSIGARSALSAKGINFDYTSKPVSQKLIADSDYIFCMTENHARAVISMFPQFADKVYVFPSEISDPYGGDKDVYLSCLDEISDGVALIIEKLGKIK